MHCARCWRQGTLTGHHPCPSWTFYSRGGIRNRKLSHITQCVVCVCAHMSAGTCVYVCVRDHGRIRESSRIKEEQHLSQSEVEERKVGQNQGSGDGSQESFPRESSRIWNMKRQLDKWGRDDEWRWCSSNGRPSLCGLISELVLHTNWPTSP